jgi:hypothetical protein
LDDCLPMLHPCWRHHGYPFMIGLTGISHLHHKLHQCWKHNFLHLSRTNGITHSKVKVLGFHATPASQCQTTLALDITESCSTANMQIIHHLYFAMNHEHICSSVQSNRWSVPIS